GLALVGETTLLEGSVEASLVLEVDASLELVEVHGVSCTSSGGWWWRRGVTAVPPPARSPPEVVRTRDQRPGSAGRVAHLVRFEGQHGSTRRDRSAFPGSTWRSSLLSHRLAFAPRDEEQCAGQSPRNHVSMSINQWLRSVSARSSAATRPTTK